MLSFSLSVSLSLSLFVCFFFFYFSVFCVRMRTHFEVILIKQAEGEREEMEFMMDGSIWEYIMVMLTR